MKGVGGSHDIDSNTVETAYAESTAFANRVSEQTKLANDTLQAMHNIQLTLNKDENSSKKRLHTHLVNGQRLIRALSQIPQLKIMSTLNLLESFTLALSDLNSKITEYNPTDNDTFILHLMDGLSSLRRLLGLVMDSDVRKDVGVSQVDLNQLYADTVQYNDTIEDEQLIRDENK